ncbi:phage tail protein [Massilia sp. BJB1822]|uniref:phage tail protein n=1 Tax=Massilia sp. BJB1822 TaxID=2744470 RepID=UPI001592D201|nr:phage tail protein [Massilia sp. BJB1822]NVD97966.1 phage tail protein [Massilia sp. BJB1822]
MSIAQRRDPLLGFNFQVSLMEAGRGKAGALTTVTLSSVGLVRVAGFSECSGLEGTLEAHEYQAGGVNGGALRFPTRIKWSNLVLKRGLGSDMMLWDWFHGFVTGKGTRRDGIVVLQDAQHQPHTVWGFRAGLPVKYSGPAMNAMQSSVAIESIEIAHQGLYLVPGASPLAVAARALSNL